MEKHYPEAWPKISPHLTQIESTSLQDLEKLAGYSMLHVNLVGRDHATGESADPRYMSLQRLMRREEPSLVQVRQWLWDEIGLKGLFTGTGYTMDDDGNAGPPEYLARNLPLADVHGIAIVDVVPTELAGWAAE